MNPLLAHEPDILQGQQGVGQTVKYQRGEGDIIVAVDGLEGEGSNRYFPRQLFIDLSLIICRRAYVDELGGTCIVLDETESAAVDEAETTVEVTAPKQKK